MIGNRGFGGCKIDWWGMSYGSLSELGRTDGLVWFYGWELDGHRKGCSNDEVYGVGMVDPRGVHSDHG